MIKLQSRYYEGLWTFGPDTVPHERGVVALVERSVDGTLRVLDAVACEDMNAGAQRLLPNWRLARSRPGIVVGVATLALRDRNEAQAVACGLQGHRQADGGWVEGSRQQPLMSGEELREMATASARRALRLE